MNLQELYDLAAKVKETKAANTRVTELAVIAGDAEAVKTLRESRDRILAIEGEVNGMIRQMEQSLV